MYRLTKHLSVDNGSNGLRFVCYMLGLIGMCCSISTLADPLYSQVEDFEPLALPDDRVEAVTDVDLSDINGKGWESSISVSDRNEKLGVILWDERGSDNQNHTNNYASGNQNIQNVNVTYNR